MVSGYAYHVRSDCEHQRKRREEGIQSADNRGTPWLVHLPASWDLADSKLENKNVHVCFLLTKTKFNIQVLYSELTSQPQSDKVENLQIYLKNLLKWNN